MQLNNYENEKKQPLYFEREENDEERKDLMNFFISLYPNGETYEHEILNTMKATNAKYEIACDSLIDLITRLNKKKLVEVFSERLDSNILQSNRIKLSEKGKNIMWKYVLNEVKENNPIEFIKILKMWIEKGDQMATIIYKQTLFKEIQHHYKSMLFMLEPITKNYLIKKIIVIENINEKNEKAIKEIDQFLKRALEWGLITYKATKDNDVVFLLTEDGMASIQAFDEQISNHSVSANNQPKKAINIKDQIKSFKTLWLINILMMVLIYLFNLKSYTNSLNGFGVLCQFIVVFIISTIISIFISNK